MNSNIAVEGRVLGRRRPLFTDWSVPLPPGSVDGGEPLTLRDLIMCVVRAEVAAFAERKAELRLRKVLSQGEIEQGLAQGKVVVGDRAFEETGAEQTGPKQSVNEKEAIDAALMAFIDGIYYVFLDDVQQEDLDAAVYLKPDSRLTFLRLVALVGG